MGLLTRLRRQLAGDTYDGADKLIAVVARLLRRRGDGEAAARMYLITAGYTADEAADICWYVDVDDHPAARFVIAGSVASPLP